MENMLLVLVGIPLTGFLISFFISRSNERALSRTGFLTAGAQFHVGLAFCLYWMWGGAPTLNVDEITVYENPGYRFFIDLYFDGITAVYLLVGAMLTTLITVYSRYYLHRESGYKRFFNTILFFYLGYNLIILSGNLETLMIGWEILGISSFLLIAFYRHRYLPVKNAVKVFSLYRLGDVGLILAMWMSHHLWHENITFGQMLEYDAVEAHLRGHTQAGMFISLMILLSAAVKSAQLPFSSWLPRAMEGPTPSSAIFYSSLSVHIGAFLLLRTHPFWAHQIWMQLLIGGLGLATTVVSSFMARVQSSIKAQVAYSSIAQIGLIFLEIALGLDKLALFHFAGNAFLRSYQLLVSPSAVTYLIREQFYHFVPQPHTFENSWSKRLQYSLYILSLKEWHLDWVMYRYVWRPLKQIGYLFGFLNTRRVALSAVPLALLGTLLALGSHWLEGDIVHLLPPVFALIGLLLVFRAFIERRSPYAVWLEVVLSHGWLALAISLNEHFNYWDIALYLGGVLVSAVYGWVLLWQLERRVGRLHLGHFSGHAYHHSILSVLFLLGCLGLAGFPITTTFIGEDLIFSHIHENQALLAGFAAMIFVVGGLALIRLYARLFLGPNEKAFYETARRST